MVSTYYHHPRARHVGQKDIVLVGVCPYMSVYLSVCINASY